MEREVGGGIGMGNTCKPMAVSFQCMTKFTTNKKKMLLAKKKKGLRGEWTCSYNVHILYLKWYNITQRLPVVS